MLSIRGAVWGVAGMTALDLGKIREVFPQTRPERILLLRQTSGKSDKYELVSLRLPHQALLDGTLSNV